MKSILSSIFIFCTAFSALQAQVTPAVNWINGSSLNVVTELNAGRSFLTNFRSTNDVTITELSGHVNSVYQNIYASSPGNNPSYISGFIGSAAGNTGDGIAGHMKMLETALTAGAATNTIQFDFSVPLDSNSRIIISDVDLNEVYKIEAYQFISGSYVSVSLAGWTATNYTGRTGITPNSTWATWNASAGTLTGNSPTPMTEPLNVFTPDQAIDRVTFTKQSQALAGSAGIQFAQLAVPEPSSSMLILGAGLCVLLRRRRMLSLE